MNLSAQLYYDKAIMLQLTYQEPTDIEINTKETISHKWGKVIAQV